MKNIRKETMIITSCFLGMLTSSCSISLFNDLSLEELQEENEIVTKSIELNEDNYHAWFLRGREYLSEGNAEMALQSFEKAVELKPEYQEATIGMGYAHLRLEDWDEAQVTFEELLQLYPNAPEGIEGLAISLYEQNENDRAKALCIEALDLDNELFRAHQILGQIYYSELDYKNAEYHWRQALLFGAPPADLEPVYQDLRLYLMKYDSEFE